MEKFLQMNFANKGYPVGGKSRYMYICQLFYQFF